MSFVDVTFTTTTTFLQSSPESLWSRTRSGFSLASTTRLFLTTHGTAGVQSRLWFHRCCHHSLPLIPPLLVGDQPSLFEDIIEKDVDDDIMAGIDICADSLRTAHDVLRVQRKPGLFAPAFCRRPPLSDQFHSPPNTQDVLLNLLHHLQGLCSTVQCPMCLLEEFITMVFWLATIRFGIIELFLPENSVKRARR